jgi:3-hydroxybutyryl-CoA dehydrogenase
METALGLVQPTTDLDTAAASVDFVIEAVVEQLDVKQQVFSDLTRICEPDAVLATNSSTIGISQIVRDLPRRERCVNMHFFHPVLVMRLVEVMRGPETSQETVDATVELAKRIGKEPVIINREIYGLVVNRILGAIKREAFWLAEEGYATPEDIDRAVKLGLNHPMGPFEVADFSGLDVVYRAWRHRYDQSGDPADRPPALLERNVQAGRLGRKTGRGFYAYPPDRR